MKTASVMIVEKSTDLRNTLRHAFEDRGYLTWTCPALEIAVSIFAAVQPHVVLLDLDFEGPNSMHLIEIWKKTAPNTRIIVESTMADAGRMQEAMRHGAHAFLVKPYQLAPLFNLLEEDIPPMPPEHTVRKTAA